MTTVLEQLSLILVATAVLLVPATALVFTIDRRQAARRRRMAARIVAYRLIVVATVVGLAAVSVDVLLGAGLLASALAGAVVTASVLAWLPIGPAWAGRGIVAWALAVDVSVAYLAYVLIWTLTEGMSWLGVLASLLLWSVGALVFLMGLGYAWEFVDGHANQARPSRGNPRPLLSRGPLRRRPRFALASWGPTARHGSMIFAAAVVGFVVFAAPLGGPDLGDLGQGTDVHRSTTDPTNQEDSELAGDRTDPTADGTSPPSHAPPTHDLSTSAAQDDTPDDQPTTTPSTAPTTEVATAPADKPPGRPTDKPPPPSNDPPDKPDHPPDKPKQH